MKALSLFSGIGGLDLAAKAAGIEIAAMCEIEPFCQQVLSKRFPSTPIISDVKTIRGEDYAGTVDIVFGGFPCQDLSVAGRGAGLDGARSGLWFEMLRVIEEVRPRFVLAENVRGAVNKALDTVRMGLEEGGYRVWPFVVPASAVGAVHRRERLFIVGIRRDVADACEERLQRCGEFGISGETAKESADELLERCGRGALWPTPTVCGNNNRKGVSKNNGDGLGTAVKIWATPTTMDHMPIRSPEALLSMMERARKGRSMPSNLREQVDAETMLLWKTPQSRDFCTGSDKKAGQQVNLNDQTGGQLNPDWVEQMMGFPEGWTNPDVDEPQPWRGWPAPMGMSLQVKLWGTPNAADCQGSHGGGQSKSLRTDIRDVKHGAKADQYPYEFPRVVKGGKYRADRLKCLGNTVVPQQAFPFLRAIAVLDEIINQEVA